MSGDVVARAKDALEGVTDGPWRTEKSKYVSGWYIISPENSTVIHATEWVGFTAPADYQFVCESRSLVPELVAEVERQRGAVEAVLDEMTNIIDDRVYIRLRNVLTRAGIL